MSIPACSHGHGTWGRGANWILLPLEVRPPEPAARIVRRLLSPRGRVFRSTAPIRRHADQRAGGINLPGELDRLAADLAVLYVAE